MYLRDYVCVCDYGERWEKGRENEWMHRDKKNGETKKKKKRIFARAKK